jgi:hypothetical protein
VWCAGALSGSPCVGGQMGAEPGAQSSMGDDSVDQFLAWQTECHLISTPGRNFFETGRDG